MTATFTLNKNDVVTIVVGQTGLTGRGEDNSLTSGGGGGASFVVKQDTILLVAGGGGGGSGDCVGWNPTATGSCISASVGTNGGFTYYNGKLLIAYLIFFSLT